MVDNLSLGEDASESQTVQSVAKILEKIAPIKGVEDLADILAEHFALKQKSDAVQSGTYILTKVVILETLQLVGVGGGLAKLDLMAFNIAQLKKKVEEINRKLDIILDAPLGQAVEYLEMALVQLNHGDISNTIEELKNVKHYAMEAFQYAKGKGSPLEILRCKVTAKQLKIFSEILIQSYDGATKIVPFPLLDKAKKEKISHLIEKDIMAVQSFHDSQSTSWYSLNKAEKKKQRQDTLDRLLQTVNPFISEGRGLTSTLEPLELPCNLRVLHKVLPEGEEDAASLVIGQLEGKPFTVKVWKDEDKVFCSYGTSAIITGKEEVTINITADHLLSALQPNFTYKERTRTFTGCILLHRLIIAGQDEEILRRRHQLDPVLLARTCQFQNETISYSGVTSQVTALHLVGIFKSSVPVVEALIEANAEVDALNGGQESALHYAAAYNPAAVQALVQANAKVNVLTQWNKSPLFWAAHYNHSEAVVCLCKAEADPYLGDSPLLHSRVNDEMNALIKQHAVAP